MKNKILLQTKGVLLIPLFFLLFMAISAIGLADPPKFIFNLNTDGLPPGSCKADITGIRFNGNSNSDTWKTEVNGDNGNNGEDQVKPGSNYTFTFPSPYISNDGTKTYTLDHLTPIGFVNGSTITAGADRGSLTITAYYVRSPSQPSCSTPLISQQPTPVQNACPGSSAAFSVAISNPANETTYQWFYRATGSGTPSPISGAIATSYSISSVGSTNVGLYFVQISNGTTCQNTSNEVSLTVDNVAPTGTAPNATTGVNACMPTQQDAEAGFDAVLAASGYTDNSGGKVTATMTSAVVSDSKCDWTITYTFGVKDGCNNLLADQTYTRSGGDKTAPTGNAPSAITLVNTCLPTQTEAVAAFDASLAASGYTDNCGGIVTAAQTSAAVTGTNCAWTITYTFGVTDECNNTLPGQTYTRSGGDKTAPDISGTYVSQSFLWPVNHKMIDITLSGATDNCSTTLTYNVTSVTSSEVINGLGDGNTSPDWVIVAGSNIVKLRAERSGVKASQPNDPGRTYTIYFTVTDACGNVSSTATNTVTVPHNMPIAPKLKSAQIASPVVAVEPTLNVYPNPFSDKLTFEFVSGKDTHAILDISNIVGQRISILMDKDVQKGMLNRIEYKPTNVVSGILIYRLILDNNIQSGKVVYKQ